MIRSIGWLNSVRSPAAISWLMFSVARADLRQQAATGEQKARLARDFGITCETVYQYLREAVSSMPRRSILSAAERESLLALPDAEDLLIQHDTFNERDLSITRQRRGAHNRLGFGVQRCYLRYPSFALPTEVEPPAPLLAIVGRQLHIKPSICPHYRQRPEPRRGHLAELQTWLCLTPCAITDYRRFVHQLAELAQQPDRGIILAETMIGWLRQQRIIVPPVDVIEHVCSEALTLGTRQVYAALTASLSDQHRHALNGLRYYTGRT